METEFQLMVRTKEMADAGQSTEDIILSVRHDDLWVASSIKIMSLPKEILDYLEAGKISRQAVAVLATMSNDKALKVFYQAKANFEDSPVV